MLEVHGDERTICPVVIVLDQLYILFHAVLSVYDLKYQTHALVFLAPNKEEQK